MKSARMMTTRMKTRRRDNEFPSQAAGGSRFSVRNSSCNVVRRIEICWPKLLEILYSLEDCASEITAGIDKRNYFRASEIGAPPLHELICTLCAREIFIAQSARKASRAASCVHNLYGQNHSCYLSKTLSLLWTTHGVEYVQQAGKFQGDNSVPAREEV